MNPNEQFEICITMIFIENLPFTMESNNSLGKISIERFMLEMFQQKNLQIEN